MKSKNINIRLYFVYFAMALFGAVILARVVMLQIIEADTWIAKAESTTIVYKNIEATRGNIYATDGSLLATSIPRYETRIDLNCEGLSDEHYQENIDSLCYHLSELFPQRSQGQWKRYLNNARKKGARYQLIKRNINYNELKAMREFPILNRGRYKGGFIYIQQNKREKPFKVLAARTIGYSRDGIKPVGLEGAYDEVLRGVSGKRLMQKIAGGVWMPINDENEIEPEDGADLVSTIDLNIQDVAENALLKQLELHQADHGCVVLMEVQTGAVKAIANLTLGKDGSYYELYNYAVGESTEPGSTFKLASLMAALEDGFVDNTDSIDTKNGVYRFYDQKMYDSHEGGFGKITVQRAFEVSSNIAVARIINENYSNNPQAFIDRLYKMNLNRPLGLEIYGEGKPNIKSANDPSWSGISLPWISHGYEVSLTPMQILAFYNAVANDGVLVKPRFVKEIRKMGQLIKTLEPEILNPSIASANTIKKAQAMLEGVVQRGTATNLRNRNYKIAGKTGTAQIANAKYGYKYESKVSHQASFVGYFPADNPKYSAIVVVNAPSRNVYYGNLVAGPIFKELADKVYATSLEIHDQLAETKPADLKRTPIPVSKSGFAQDLEQVFNKFSIPTVDKHDQNEWVSTVTGSKNVVLHDRGIAKEVIPNVKGMPLKDALFILENMNLNVQFTGKGAVKKQFPRPGSSIEIGRTVKLELS